MLPSIFSGTEIVRYLAVFFGSLSIINSGMVYGWPSIFLPQLLQSSEKIMTTAQGSWIAVAPLLGAILTTPLFCNASDFIGPKKTILFSFYPYILSWMTICLSKNFEMFFIGRLIAGISDGCIFTTLPIYFEDICNKDSRKNLNLLFIILFSCGILIINLIGSVLSVFYAALLASTLPLVSFAGMLVMPESPYYLIMKDKDFQARDSLRYTTGSSEIDDEYDRVKQETQFQKSLDLSLREILNLPLRAFFIVVLVVVASQQCTGISALVFYATTIMTETNNSFYFDSNFGVILFTLLLIMAVLYAFFLNSNDIKFLLLWSIFGSGASLFIVGLYFQFMKSDNSSLFSLIPVSAMIIYIIFYGLGLQNIPFVMVNEIFPRSMKPRVLGFTYFCLAILATFSSILFSISNDFMRVYVAFYFFSVCCAINFFLILIFVPKSENKCDESKALLGSDEYEQFNHQFLISSLEISDYSD